MPLSDKELSDKIKEIYAPMLREHLSAPPSLSYERFTQKKEVKEMSRTINLVLSAEGLAKYIKDLQELAPSTKRKLDERGNYVYDAETGDYLEVEIPLHDRKVEINYIRLTEDGKFAFEVSPSTFAKMEALYAQKARIAEYQTA